MNSQESYFKTDFKLVVNPLRKKIGLKAHCNVQTVNSNKISQSHTKNIFRNPENKNKADDVHSCSCFAVTTNTFKQHCVDMV